MLLKAALHRDNSVTGKLKSTMKKKIILPITALLMVVILGSCNKDQAPTLQDSTIIASGSTDQSIAERFQWRVLNLGTASNFAILSKSGITDVYPSAVNGNIGTSPITGAAIHLTCAEVTGNIFTVNAAGPLPCRITNASKLTTAVSDMQAAYTNAAGRLKPKYLNLGAGNIGGKTLSQGLYKWTTNVIIPTNITISGSATDVWIFQISGTLKVSSAVNVTLSGGALAKNIFWQTTEAVTLGTTSHFEGTILSKTAINMKTGASINGRLLAQTAVSLEMNTVVKP